MLLSDPTLQALLACPACRSGLTVDERGAASCPACGARYRRLTAGWDLRPPREQVSGGEWDVWEQLQANGAVSYDEDAEHNLGVGEREDCRRFGRFCDLQGAVLDVGCGPQPWPAYFVEAAPGTHFVGVDPLVGERPGRYPQLRALAEHLPFTDGAFDRVLLATTLDHFVDPVRALEEAGRVLSGDGHVVVWIGHKRPGAPRPDRSPEWYRRLVRPAGADDVFHVKRLDPDEATALFDQAGLAVIGREQIAVDAFRSNHFFRLSPR